MKEFLKFLESTLVLQLNKLSKTFGQKINIIVNEPASKITTVVTTVDKTGLKLVFEVERYLNEKTISKLADACYYWDRNHRPGEGAMFEIEHVPGFYVREGTQENRMFLDFGNGVKVPCRHYPFSAGRTSRVLNKMGVPFPEYRVAPGYPEKLRGETGWPARWAEAHAECVARGAFKVMASGYGRLAIDKNAYGVQDPTPGAHWEAPGDHNAQDWPQYEL